MNATNPSGSNHRVPTQADVAVWAKVPMTLREPTSPTMIKEKVEGHPELEFVLVKQSPTQYRLIFVDEVRS